MAKLPKHWVAQPRFHTLQDLADHRKRQKLPHLSFDLDGDGTVGPTDLVIASRFDTAKCGRLNTAQQTQAKAAMAQAQPAGLSWGWDASGDRRAFRLVQVRGVPAVAEDFSAVASTYPRTFSKPRKRSGVEFPNRKRSAELDSVLTDRRFHRNSQFTRHYGAFIQLSQHTECETPLKSSQKKQTFLANRLLASKKLDTRFCSP